MPRTLWAKAPLALLRHRSVLLAIASASFLVALAAASAPLLRAGAESEALKGKLDQLTPLAAGLTIETAGARDRDLVRGDRARRAAAARLARTLPFVGAPILTTSTFAAVGGRALEGGRPLEIVPMARTGGPAHVRRLSGDGRGAFVASSVARLAHVHSGGQLDLIPFGPDGTPRGVLHVPVGAVYVPLDADLGNPYWVNFTARIRPTNPDAPPLPTFLLVSQGAVYRIAQRTAHGTVANVFEFPVQTASMTPSRARDVASHFAAVRRSIAHRTPLARSLGCGACNASSSLEAAVILSAKSVDALTPVISLLAGFAALIALGAALVAGVFNVRRRSAEARLSVVGGESRTAFAVRAALECAAPALVGAAAGLLCAAGLTRIFTPAGTIDNAVLRSALASTAAAAAVSVAAVAAGAWAARGPAIERAPLRHRFSIVPWEVPVLAAAAISYALIEHGGGLVKNAAIGAHPRLIVLLFPLALAAGVAGVASRLLRRSLRHRQAARDVVFLALRRLAAARALLVLLIVTAAVSCCALTFAELLGKSLDSTSAEKAYVANGGDVQGLIDASQRLPRSFPYPLAKVEQSLNNAQLDDGTPAELLAVDPASLRRVIRWRWSGDPRAALAALQRSSAPLPAISVGAGHPRAVSIGGRRIPIRVVATVDAFPGMVAGEPLLVVPSAPLSRVAATAGIANPVEGATAYVWARGEPGAVEAALARSSLAPFYLTSVDHFLQSADLTTAARTYGFLRVIALGAALIALVALLLYLHARSRSQLVTSAFLVRMGMSPSAQAASVALEAAALVAFAALVGAGSALLAATQIVSRVDPLPQYAPAATVDTPWLLLAGSLLLLVVLAAAAGASACLLARRGDLGAALRVA
jgi:putative ABC transport system permease protein